MEAVARRDDRNEYKIKNLAPDYKNRFQVFIKNFRQAVTGGLCGRAAGTNDEDYFPGGTTETRDCTPFIWDDNGEEHCLGSVMGFVQGSMAEITECCFPDEEEDSPRTPFA
jgi:hypothetical protein